ncbi:hypothetical protein C0991_009322 [Blastosporella zonata]|nr:hypothetical protein C0991_009322 [Blastosporella zonata]
MLDSEDDYDDAGRAEDVQLTQEDIRYWSDFNRVYYVPRTVQKIPDPAEWENISGDWNQSHIAFSRYDEVGSLVSSVSSPQAQFQNRIRP